MSYNRSHNINSKKSCPQGYTLRKGYYRKYGSQVREHGFNRVVKGKTVKTYPSDKRILVKSACVRLKSFKKIGPLRSGDLIKYGYQYRLPSDKRREALKEAINSYGAVSTYRKLDAIAKLGVKKMPKAAEVFAADRDWVHRHYIISKRE